MSDQVNDSLGEDIPGGQESEASVRERLSELKKKAAQMASSKKAMKREEGNTRKNEQKIVQFLMSFLQTRKESKLLKAVLDAISVNISANIIIQALLLIHEDLLNDMDEEDLEGEEFDKLMNGVESMKQLNSGVSSNQEKAVIAFSDSHDIPVHIKTKLYIWAGNIYEVASIYPYRTIELFEEEKNQDIFKYLLTEIIFEFLISVNINIHNQSIVKVLVDKIFINLLAKLSQVIENIKFIEGE